MIRKIMMGAALAAAVAAFNPGVALAQGHGHGGGGGHMGGGGGAHFGGGGGAHFGGGGGAHFGGGFARGGGGGFNSFAAHGGVRNSFASTNSGVMRNATVNRSFSNTARMSQNMQYHHWNNGNSGWHHHGRRHAFFAPGLAFGYGYYGGYYDDYPYDSAYYDDGYYGDDYAYNDYDGCYRIQRYHTRSGWHKRTVNVCQ